MCNCCFKCCGWFGHKFSPRKLNEAEKQRRKIYCGKLFHPLAIILCCIFTFESVAYMLLYGSCLVFYKLNPYFNTLAFGNCNEAKLYFYLLEAYLALQTVLGFACIYGFFRRLWRYIIPFMSLRGVYIAFNALTYMFGTEGYKAWEMCYLFFTIVTLIFTWVSMMITYLQIYGETEPIERNIYYDET